MKILPLMLLTSVLLSSAALAQSAPHSDASTKKHFACPMNAMCAPLPTPRPSPPPPVVCRPNAMCVPLPVVRPV